MSRAVWASWSLGVSLWWLAACGTSAPHDGSGSTGGTGTATTGRAMSSTTGAADTTSTADPSTTFPPPGRDLDPCLFASCFDQGATRECSLFVQDCPVGEKCMPWAYGGGTVWNATRCSPVVDAPGALGDPCAVEGDAYSGIDDCDLGLMCFDVDPKTNLGICVALCQGNDADPICPRSQICAVAGDSPLPLCLATCDPLSQDCVRGWGCHPYSGDAFVCVPTGSEGSVGDPCDDGSRLSAACSAGAVCVDAGAVPGCVGVAACCASYCDTSVMDPCPGAVGGEQCVSWFPPGTAPAGLETVGVCIIPA